MRDVDNPTSAYSPYVVRTPTVRRYTGYNLHDDVQLPGLFRLGVDVVKQRTVRDIGMDFALAYSVKACARIRSNAPPFVKLVDLWLTEPSNEQTTSYVAVSRLQPGSFSPFTLFTIEFAQIPCYLLAEAGPIGRRPIVYAKPITEIVSNGSITCHSPR